MAIGNLNDFNNRMFFYSLTGKIVNKVLSEKTTQKYYLAFPSLRFPLNTAPKFPYPIPSSIFVEHLGYNMSGSLKIAEGRASII